MVFLFAFGTIGAQPLSEKLKKKIDTNYVHSYHTDLIVRVYTADKGNHFLIGDNGNDLNIKYRSNDLFKLGVGVNYKWFGLKIGFELPFANSNVEKYGSSSSFGLQSYLVARRFVVDIVARKTNGYYLSLHGKAAEDISDEEVYQVRSDIKITNFGVNFIYVLNSERFSYKAAFNQTDLQLRSAGSLIWGGGLASSDVDGDETLIPDELLSEAYEEWQGLDKFRSYSGYGSLGYAYSLVPFSNAIITASLATQMGIRLNQLHFERQRHNYQTKLGFGGEIRIAGGYHFPGFYLGGSFVQSHFNSDVRFSSLQIANGTSFLEFTVSKRIKL